MKKALITGITGQDGSYLAELLLSKGYEVHGIKRRSSSFNTERIDHLYQDPHIKDRKLILHYGDMTDVANLFRIVQKVQPDEIYNLAAQSHVQVSFEKPEYTANTDGLGTLRLLEAIKILGLEKKTKFYQASTSELFSGKPGEAPQNENTLFHPRSPYGVAKLYAYWITVNYREAYNIFACNGVLFNHESKKRGETFVTRKITRAAAKIKLGLQDKLYLGNLNAKRDWGHSKDSVEAMWLMLQQPEPDDYVIASGEQHSVREFCELAFRETGIDLEWQGQGIDEKGIDILISAFKQVGDKFPFLRLIIVGKGPQEKYLKSMVENQGINNVVFLGIVNHQKIPEILNCADLFVLPSAFEGTPLAVLEALACGVPVISFDVGDISRIITDGLNGYLVKNRTSKALARAIISGIETRSKMQRNCRKTTKNYWASNVIPKILDIYNEVRFNAE